MKKQFAYYCKRLWNGVGEILVVLAIMVPFRSSIADWNHVPSGSMKPTILKCERVFVNKLAYDLKVPLTTWHLAEWGNPERGDIVVFYSPADQKRLVKRVIGLPGDIVELRNNQLVINGQFAEYVRLDAQYTANIADKERARSVFAREQLGGLDHPIMIMPFVPAKRSFGPVKVPENQYLMFGDNRDDSADSRFFGFVERKQIVGKVPIVVASFDPDKFYFPRLNRWFKLLP